MVLLKKLASVIFYTLIDLLVTIVITVAVTKPRSDLQEYFFTYIHITESWLTPIWWKERMRPKMLLPYSLWLYLSRNKENKWKCYSVAVPDLRNTNGENAIPRLEVRWYKDGRSWSCNSCVHCLNHTCCLYYIAQSCLEE